MGKMYDQIMASDNGQKGFLSTAGRRWWEHVLLSPVYGLAILLLIFLSIFVAIPLVLIGQVVRWRMKYSGQGDGRLSHGHDS
jgi:hypothetical protein